MLKCKKCLEEKPESLFVQIKGMRVGMVCRKCRSAQIVAGRHNREAIEKRLSERLVLASVGSAKCSKCDVVKSDCRFPQKNCVRHGSVCKDCTTELKKGWHQLTVVGVRAQKKSIEREAKKAQRAADISARKAKQAYSFLPSSLTTCAICSTEKVNTEFHTVRGKRHGKRCLDCATVAAKAFREKRFVDAPDLHRALRSHESNMRRAGVAQRIPPWADKQEIAKIYAGRPAGHHVDHTIPLFGKLVSGLHVEGNLQYLTATENMKKNRSFTP